MKGNIGRTQTQRSKHGREIKDSQGRNGKANIANKNENLSEEEKSGGAHKKVKQMIIIVIRSQEEMLMVDSVITTGIGRES